MPTYCMHLTALEVTHSRTPDEIAALVAKMEPAVPAMAAVTFRHRCRLVKPLLSYDLSAIAVSFLPAAGEPVLSPPPVAPHDHSIIHPGVGGWTAKESDPYTYHHLRRDLFDMAKAAGLDIASRYVVPSAHITLGRYLTQKDHDTPEMRERWVQAIADINEWLQAEVWDAPDGEFVGEWLVGQERGLEVRSGPLWYGAGRTVLGGPGF